MATLRLNHIARETSDVPRLAAFYEAVLGFERVPSPNYSGFQVAWLRLPKSPDVALHLIERDPAAAPVAVGPGAEGAPPSQLPRRHHLAFSVADYDGFVTGLKARGTELFEKTQPDGRTRQVFFFDPDALSHPIKLLVLAFGILGIFGAQKYSDFVRTEYWAGATCNGLEVTSSGADSDK